EGISEPQVELVLASCDLVVAGFDRYPEMVERLDDLLPDFAAQVDRMVEVARPVMPTWMQAACRVRVQEEELQLDRDRVIEAQHRGAVEPFAVAHRMGQPLGRNRDALYRPKDIDEA